MTHWMIKPNCEKLSLFNVMCPCVKPVLGLVNPETLPRSVCLTEQEAMANHRVASSLGANCVWNQGGNIDLDGWENSGGQEEAGQNTGNRSEHCNTNYRDAKILCTLFCFTELLFCSSNWVKVILAAKMYFLQWSDGWLVGTNFCWII